ncbi:MAG: hypothetical protein ACI94Z_002150 [Yoonia sp.]
MRLYTYYALQLPYNFQFCVFLVNTSQNTENWIKMKIFIYSALVISTSLSFSVMSVTDEETSIEINKEIQQQRAVVCSYYPNECPVTTTGAGNGGGNEPPSRYKSKLH